MNRPPFLVLCVALAACSVPSPALLQDDDTVSLDDIVFLAQSDISDQTILTYLKHRRLDFVLDAEGVQELREAGVSEEIIRYLLENPYALNSVWTAYARPVDYYASYPSYYYGTTLVSVTVFPHYWYDHHYFGFGHLQGCGVRARLPRSPALLWRCLGHDKPRQRQPMMTWAESPLKSKSRFCARRSSTKD